MIKLDYHVHLTLAATPLGLEVALGDPGMRRRHSWNPKGKNMKLDPEQRGKKLCAGQGVLAITTALSCPALSSREPS